MGSVSENVGDSSRIDDSEGSGSGEHLESDRISWKLSLPVPMFYFNRNQAFRICQNLLLSIAVITPCNWAT